VRTVALAERRPSATGPTCCPRAWPSPTKLDLLFRADDTARSAGAAVSQVQAGYGDSRRRVLIANSDGLLAEDDQGSDPLQRRRCGHRRHRDADRLRERRPPPRGGRCSTGSDVDDVARTAANRALSEAGRPARLPPVRCPWCWLAAAGGILFHEACGHGLEADHIVKDASVYVGQVGQLVASPLVTLVDDGTVGGGMGNFAVDDEGRPAAATC